MLAPNAELVNRPMTVREPFAYPHAERHPLAPIVADAGAELIVDELEWVDPERRDVHTKGGAELSYDALVLALGARIEPRYEHAITIDDRHLEETAAGADPGRRGRLRRGASRSSLRRAWPGRCPCTSSR